MNTRLRVKKRRSYFIMVTLIFLIFSCDIIGRDQHIIFRKIPCDLEQYSEIGVPGVSRQVFFAIDNLDGNRLNSLNREKTDTLVIDFLRNIDPGQYAYVTIRILKDSDKLKDIHNCEITDAHNINSSEHLELQSYQYSKSAPGTVTAYDFNNNSERSRRISF